METFLNVTNSTTSLPLSDLGDDLSLHPYSTTGNLSVFEYAAVIAILAVFVFMAIVFTIYGLFMKAEAHKHSAVDVLGMEGHKESLMFSQRESYSPWHSDFDATWP